jgi:AraC family transcriptional regulator
MADVAVIARAIDYIEANLKESIAVADMAANASYSLYHFCRMFNEATHQTPYDYLVRRRLSEAARALVLTDAKIIDIAFDYQFNSPETFSRAFKRLFEIQPRQWRARGLADTRKLIPRLSQAHLRHIAKGPYLNPVLVTHDTLTITGLMRLWPGDRSTRYQLWGLLDRELAGIEEEGHHCYCALTVFTDATQGQTTMYLAGVEDQGLSTAGTALVSKQIPPLACARFIHKGFASELPLTLDYVYHTWLPRSGMSLSLPWVIERFGDTAVHGSRSDGEWEVYVPIQEPSGGGHTAK